MHASAQYLETQVLELLKYVGEDVRRSGLIDTPKRVAKAYVDSTSGYDGSVAGTIGQAVFEEPLVTKGPGGLVLVRNVHFASTSEDTLMPFHGQCHIAYIPAVEAVLGLSKLARLVVVLSKRLTSQQSLADAVMDAVGASVRCKGVLVFVQARHLSRAYLPTLTTTSARSGCFAKPDSSELTDVTLLLQLGGVDVDAGPQTTDCPDPSALPSLPLVSPAPDKSGMAAVVHNIYNALLPEGARVGAAAAAAYVDLLEQQTLGYRSSLQSVLCKHALRPSPPATSASDGESPSVSNQTAVSKASTGGEMMLSRASRGASFASSMDCGYASDSGSDAPSDGGPHSGAEGERQVGEGGRVRCTCLGDVGGAHSCAWHVSFASQCEHHLLPFYGGLNVVVAGPTQPSAAILKDIVDLFGCRLQIQERITHQVADAVLDAVPDCAGVLVTCDALHMCMVARGVEKHASSTITTAYRGIFAEKSGMASSVLRLLVAPTSLDPTHLRLCCPAS